MSDASLVNMTTHTVCFARVCERRRMLWLLTHLLSRNTVRSASVIHSVHRADAPISASEAHSGPQNGATCERGECRGWDDGSIDHVSNNNIDELHVGQVDGRQLGGKHVAQLSECVQASLCCQGEKQEAKNVE